MYKCKICNYTTSVLSRYNKHINKKNPCKPVNSESNNETSPKDTQHENTKNSTINCSNNVTTNITNNIYINCFGKDDLLYLLGDTHLTHQLKHYSPDGVYALLKLDDVYQYDRLDIKEEDDEFCRCMKGYLGKYIDIYRKRQNGDSIRSDNFQDIQIIKKLVTILLTVGNMINDDLEISLGIDKETKDNIFETLSK